MSGRSAPTTRRGCSRSTRICRWSRSSGASSAACQAFPTSRRASSRMWTMSTAWRSSPRAARAPRRRSWRSCATIGLAGEREAEVAFVVQDAWQGHGIATALLHELAAYARAHGVERFVALTMGTNARMLDVLHNCGFPCHTRYDGGDILATLDITAPPRSAALAADPGDTEGAGSGPRTGLSIQSAQICRRAAERRENWHDDLVFSGRGGRHGDSLAIASSSRGLAPRPRRCWRRWSRAARRCMMSRSRTCTPTGQRPIPMSAGKVTFACARSSSARTHARR